jgi:hypothetical protein
MNALQNWRTEAKALPGHMFESRRRGRRLMVLFPMLGERQPT